MRDSDSDAGRSRGAGVDLLWAPWRIGYVTGEREGGCFLCRKGVEEPDRSNLIVARWGNCFALLNTFPYNNGHLMIAPYRHVGDWEALDEAEIMEIGEGMKRMLGALRSVLNPDGFNVGMNLGEAAGAGVPGHLHIHVVPRWKADTNFLPVLAATKVIPQHLEETWKALRQALEASASTEGADE